jgi:DNA adenine methylase
VKDGKTETPTRPILRYHGGKWRLAKWIVAQFPPHTVYVEPFGGAASVLLQKPRSYAEVYNDLDREIVNLFRMVRDRGDELLQAVELTPYARDEFDQSFSPTDDPLEQARRTIIRSHMGFGGNLTRPNRDQTPQRTGWRTYTKKNRRSIPAGDWRNWPEALPSLIDRLRGVIIENRDAMSVMAEHDGENTLHYVDPPYVHSTRRFDSGGTVRGYRHEMTDEQHRTLGSFLKTLKGAVVLSGYPCELYDSDLYRDWLRIERRAMADGARGRVEVLWLRNCDYGLFAQRSATEEMEAAS